MTRLTTGFAGSALLACAGFAQAEDISATALFAAYERNQIVAEDGYNGRRITISGRVSAIEDAMMGASAVFLAAGENGKSVRCHFPKNAKPELAGVKVGDQVTFACTVEYRMNSTIHASSCSRN